MFAADLNETIKETKPALSALPIENNFSSALHGFEKQILDIFIQDKEQEIPVFLYIEKNIPQKIAKVLVSKDTRPTALAIAGESASGKSTFASCIVEPIRELQKHSKLVNLITNLSTDDYYHDRSEEVKLAGSFDNFAKNYDLDCPDAIDLSLLKTNIETLLSGNSAMLPKYDMSGTAIRWDNHTKAEPSKLVITEGLFALHKDVINTFDFKIYVDVSPETQRQRWFKRAKERNVSAEADIIFLNTIEKAKLHVKPTLKNADIIINGEATPEQYKATVQKFIELVYNFAH